MFWNKKYKSSDPALDGIAKAAVRGGGIGDEESDRIASSPFLYARLRARIEAGRAAKSAPDNGWLEGFRAARRAMLALASVAMIAVLSLWVAGRSNDSVGSPAGVEPVAYQPAPVTACALSATSECVVSNEEVLATMFAEQKGKEQR